MSNEIAVLQLMQTKGLGTTSLRRLLKILNKEKRPIDDFIFSSINEMINEYSLKEEVADSIKNVRDEAELLSEKLYEHGMKLLYLGNKAYPKMLIDILGDTAPPVLFTKGEISILKQKSVGYCGSRKSSERGIKIATESSKLLAKKGINIVSGYAFGIDNAAHKAALDSGGVTTIVLSEGILQFKVKKVIEEFFNDNNYLIISEYPPGLPWINHNAMQRNRTICGISNAMIMVESGLKGGTFAAGQTAFDLQRPLFVFKYSKPSIATEGNEYFIKRGAYTLQGDENVKIDLSKVFEILESSEKYNSALPLFL